MRCVYFSIIFLYFSYIQTYGQSNELKVEADKITIPIGNELKINVDVEDEKLTGFELLEQKVVEDKLDIMDALDDFQKPNIISNEIELKFCYAGFLGTKIVVLVIVQHFEKAIIFKAKIKIKGSIGYKETSITEKNPNVFCIEQWQQDIESIFLYDFEVIK
ncbi:MAG: hypothetical protein JW866_00205 [Ignavibacteriales bacterium]|nr:hypothetical protein [Ignavibacteriales bacterium]